MPVQESETGAKTAAKMPRSTKRIFCVEGNIGVGKTTLLKRLKELGVSGAVVIEEPVDEWTKVEISPGVNMLQAMYTGELSKATFQMAILQSRFGPLQRALLDPEIHTVITERSPWSEKLVFASTNLSPTDMAAYNYTHASSCKFFLSVCKLNVTFVYLDAGIEALSKRIATRSRTEESGISVEYLERLEYAHEKMRTDLVDVGSLGIEDGDGAPKHVQIDATQEAGAVFDAVKSLVWPK